MKIWRPFLFVIASIGIATLFQNCTSSMLPIELATSAEPSSEASSMTAMEAASTNSGARMANLGRLGLLHFGYWGSAMDSINPTRDEYIDELADTSNVVFVTGFEAGEVSTNKIIQKIKKAKAKNLATVLVVQGIFFKWGTVSLREKPTERFQALWNGLVSESLESSVQGFYIFDEPYGNNHQAFVTDPITHAIITDNRIPDLEARDNLNFVASELKKIAPHIPSMIVFGADEINYINFYSDLIPKQASWIGFDCYSMEGERCSESAIRTHFQKFLNVATINQQGLILIPDAFATKAPTDTEQYQILNRLRLYKELSTSSWLVKAIYPWLYQDYTSADGLTTYYYGASSLPHVKTS